jgi:cytochrome c
MRFAALISIAFVVAIASPARAVDGKPEDGAEVFKKCRACHEIGPGTHNKVGPVLTGIIGRRAGTIEGFAYSPANKKAGADGWVWTEEKLLQYLTNPRQAMPGNRMAFVGLADEQDRADLLAYLKTFPAQ